MIWGTPIYGNPHEDYEGVRKRCNLHGAQVSLVLSRKHSASHPSVLEHSLAEHVLAVLDNSYRAVCASSVGDLGVAVQSILGRAALGRN